jgi:hypothetical protein
MKNVMLKRMNVWMRHDGTYTCDAEFEGSGGKVNLELQPELGARIVDLCLSDIVESIQISAADAVRELTAAKPKVVEHWEETE